MKINKKELSIYIHIPFCKKKCLYCDFLSAPCGAVERESYIKALLCEIRRESVKAAEYTVMTVFLGGGTPSILSCSQIDRILNCVRKNYRCDDNMEVTLECNPGTASLCKLTGFRKAGINRLSIGLQSADNRELHELGRIHTYEKFKETMNHAREAGFENINIDIMSALPGQTLESYQDTMTKVIDMKPEHISAYSLIIEEGTPFYERYGNKRNESYPLLPDEDTERNMYYETKHFLETAGFHRYEISNYAVKGYECRHNLSYWTQKNYLGFGTGAASCFEGTRYSNIRDNKEYILNTQNNLNLHTDITHLTQKDKEEEYMYVGLRLTKGISVTGFAQQFESSMEEVYGEVITQLIKKRLLCKRGDYLKLTKKGIDISNYVLAHFLQD